MSNDEREARLPKWAQREMRTLRMRVAERDARATAEATEKTAVWYGRPDDALYGMAPAKPLGEVNDKIYFVRPDGDRDYFTVSIDDEGALEIYGIDSLAVEPKVSNVIRVRLARA